MPTASRSRPRVILASLGCERPSVGNCHAYVRSGLSNGVLTIRPTQKLAKRLGVELLPEAAPSTTILGDWYCTLLYTRPKQLILAVSEKSRLPLLFPAAGTDLFEERLPAALGQTLLALGVPVSTIEKEQVEMSVETVYAKTASRSLLGTINEFSFALDAYLPEGNSLLDATLWLADTPIRPMQWARPVDVVVELLAR